ncbi:hypothetical protein SAMN05216388_100938 [Halorientalis persicus]|uniref:Uncharacterized protein n=1 Tax=Halorientalis persicus TaxID=1367881 RepID=A0A1H8MLB7_9EURY|nr:hypothetical protein [Halorientalis persicus]SEO18073.1 hypothetical protein SAMN05216388_100938 [Halorientalis persicus]
MSWDYVTYERFQDGIGPADLVVNVMKENGTDKERWDAAYNAVRDALEKVYQNTGISTGVWKIDSNTNISCNNKEEDANETIDEETIYGHEQYLWVLSCSDWVAYSTGSAWTDRANAFISEDNFRYSDASYGFGHNAVHEALHGYLSADVCDEIQSQILNNSGHDGNSKDHALGKVWSRGVIEGAPSPMLGTYGQDTAEHGDCNHFEHHSDYSKKITDCTYDALQLSKEHENNNH